ncbi:conserved hypothetical protein [Talaromyces stipitatus ATCC 10500]|uniref:Purple acid phosphatase n=1 Tax=Talaromyces stipitatus (strain ATCC 10500 / CBS 375.48 / QM 6759 / NRRL 1006) TaxID=441959 RepID=B8M2M8_TALSN|nr:uncharacterized protein TSTA_091800 [Talaromyces stipitatus ATCC 10500]EED21939.1 conserved hypothetical protein [Talaromyces stipitatus ATCC 10500]
MERGLKASILLATIVCASVSTAKSECTDKTAPMQMRLAYAGDRGMTVSWNTYSKLDHPSVRYGLHPDSLDRKAVSDVSVTYPTSTTYNNHVKINGLKPDTLYYYQPQCGNSSQIYSMKTARPVGDSTPFTIAVAGDMGLIGPDGLTTTTGPNGGTAPLGPGDNNTIQSMESLKSEWDFFWHPGDIAYADYWLKEEAQGFLPNYTVADGQALYEKFLNEYFDEMTALTADRPYMVGPGNHDSNCDNGGTTSNGVAYNISICPVGQTNFTGFRNHYRMPSQESSGVENFWYSFNHGMVHFIQLNTETDIGGGFVAPDEPGGSEGMNSGPFGSYPNEQLDWLKNDLESVDRSKTPWVIAAVHRPWYVSAKNTSGSICTICKDVFEPLLVEYGVDLVMQAHTHYYERNQPLNNYVIDPAGLNNPQSPWYITSAAPGHYDGLDSLVRPLKPYVVYAQDTAYGWSKITFHNCSHMTHEFVASRNNTILDTATLFKDRKCEPGTGGDDGGDDTCEI